MAKTYSSNEARIEAQLAPQTKARRQAGLGSQKAKCGHIDPLGYLAGTVCGKCARRNHRRAVHQGKVRR